MRWPDHPPIAERVLLLPGNHDVNIVDRANPARLDLSIGPNSRLRKIRTLSAINTIQGSRVRVVDRSAQKIGASLAEALQPHAADLTKFAATGRPYFSTSASDRWDEVFPMVLPPDGEDGLGIILLNSNSDFALLVHQCAGDGFGGTGKGDRHRFRAVPQGMLAHRGTPPSRSSIRARRRSCRSASARPWSTATGSCAVCSRWRSGAS